MLLAAGLLALAAQPAVVPACRADGDPDEIVVCAPRDDSDEYRLPRPDRFDPSGPIDSVSRERHRLL